ncbi:type IV pilus modification PilV family protein [Arsenophonus apicola]|uniref:Prepilin-type N-terminal cleavage/methylation domain-containing protein n=1 Tax=Arsenophonus apicola TaxID=2879119 RepID=A0ABY8P3D8_9GAMM|nr:prepilin-type N-terminal cleavage/methylation domain-containing protein [Arsenophonus apicola]WGO84013.1 prepilin-type N-terminal cleavage/methylation domain-containing protein [Arsenophonus apicola]
MKRAKLNRQSGMAITEVMIAIALFAISAIALIKYVHNLKAGFFLAWQKTQQFRLMHTFFESEEAMLSIDSTIADITNNTLKNIDLSYHYVNVTDTCKQMLITFKMPYNHLTTASRWYCSSGRGYATNLSF